MYKFKQLQHEFQTEILFNRNATSLLMYRKYFQENILEISQSKEYFLAWPLAVAVKLCNFCASMYVSYMRPYRDGIEQHI